MRTHRRVAGVAVATLLLPACTGGGDGGGPEPLPRDWSAIEAAADGQTVNLFMWGGDSGANAYLDDQVAPAAAELGITVHRVPVADTQDAVQKVLGDLRAGKDRDGAVDLVWVNGENFLTGKQAGAWLCGYPSRLPNLAYVDTSDPTISHDFGIPVDDCETPWSRAQFAFVYDSARVPEPPRTMADLLAWAVAHPGRFTYPAPPDFTGSAFVRHVLYATAGGASAVPATYRQDAYDAVTPGLWRQLTDLAPHLWRGGETYPTDAAALHDLFANGEVDLTMTYGPAEVPRLVEQGLFPATTRVFVLAEGTLGNTNYLAVPVNAAHREAALVLSNLLLSPEQQYAKAQPGGWGAYPVLDERRLPEPWRERFAAIETPATVLPFEELSRNAQPELAGDWLAPLEEGWRAEVLAGG